ncbi:hypothetical protein [Winogradskyella sp.]|uniref:hypothetical protein n=1 Tax=Winogradskyella sp. TaxID=1883156 RepID=UPI003F6C0D68
MKAKVSFVLYATADFDVIFKAVVYLSFAVNDMNRTKNLPDDYPFVIYNYGGKKLISFKSCYYPFINQFTS